MRREEIIGDARLLLGDCREILPTLGDGFACVTDPPYGINHARDRNSQKNGWVDYPDNGWDTERPSAAVFDMILQASTRQIIWGGNYFTDLLPFSSRWLIWDKGQSDFSLADAELAWCSEPGAVRRIFYSRALALQEGKEHPTQKPVAVMQWCLRFVMDDSPVLDPFMGSGSTGIACIREGHTFVGIEASQHYFDIACRRIEAEHRRPRLPLPEPVRPATQEALL